MDEASDSSRVHDPPWPDVWYYADQRGRVGPLSLEADRASKLP